MVRVGFIVEGDTEKILLESKSFKDLMAGFKLNYVPEIINAGGNGNLLPHNIDDFSNILFAKGASQIIILTDLDKDLCVTQTKNRIKPKADHLCIIAKKEIESWFLADSEAINKYIGISDFEYKKPEDCKEPFDEIKEARKRKQGIGIGSKKKLAKDILDNGFSFEKAANHPGCSSAKYFLDKLKNLA